MDESKQKAFIRRFAGQQNYDFLVCRNIWQRRGWAPDIYDLTIETQEFMALLVVREHKICISEAVSGMTRLLRDQRVFAGHKKTQKQNCWLMNESTGLWDRYVCRHGSQDQLRCEIRSAVSRFVVDAMP